MKHIFITQEHIEKGKRRDPCKCPVALAISEQTIFQAIVELEFVVLGNARIPLPEKATKFIGDFDYGKRVWPLQFELRVDP